ncbi:hypothetical protein [Pseudorhodobacter antarcticus]|jgi:hypothetical protein|nr:hypothetical protein [Pseudorhodobacter antarcticus]
MDEPDQDVELTKVCDQRSMILSILCDFLEEDRIADLGDWLDHAGFDLTAIRYPADLPAAWVAHYRNGRSYDVDRALNDLLAWPPIAAEIAFLSKQSQVTVSTPNGPGNRAPKSLPIDLGKLADDL